MSLKHGRLRRGLETWVLLSKVSANPLWGPARATRLAAERKSAETHPTARLRPLGAWLLRPVSPRRERVPYIALSTLS